MPEIPLVPVRWRFPAHPTSVRRARHAVTESLPHALRPHLGDDLLLLTSELVTNAIRHGTCGEDDDLIELVLWPADGHYWLAVSDPGTHNPQAPHPGPDLDNPQAPHSNPGSPQVTHPATDSENGRGLILVDTLAAAWTIRPRPTRGTSVIAGLPLHQTP
ncbi:ATP-binding protein [Streptomyces sudanensis]|uniref:ATP-binding protein n=1 Tax=Streptomyces sudanensis TaxID=436397 RepID=UPI0020CCB25E|nr:ATP-binding protein [Streptomyces sudanensis]MCP9986433.1 ATP-binding protein [Streptomyces sudanensis]